jgi:hypothetical protein
MFFEVLCRELLRDFSAEGLFEEFRLIDAGVSLGSVDSDLCITCVTDFYSDHVVTRLLSCRSGDRWIRLLAQLPGLSSRQVLLPFLFFLRSSAA